MLARLEALMSQGDGLLAKDVARAAGLSPQDISTYRTHGRMTDEKRARLWAWMTSQGGAE